ncbi:Cro/CI family transcriptional regulator [Pseudomonas nitroreducens]|uniref:Cro/Cl family transcriptional regulator n=1 Tax=Pseudomonas nitroreducens TaxID=46680 RepID=A0A6G6J0J5_PSENT|nr:Cro/CI family transcriptional regulator [Pseudomonas nitroreducens]QIE88001.1 hypothetical protein G5B91_17655 [Pseudomonas nitroreducens]
MRRITIHDFADEKGQVKAAALLGIRQSSLSKALRVGRDIYVTEHDDGSFSAEELRPFPSQPKTQAA